MPPHSSFGNVSRVTTLELPDTQAHSSATRWCPRPGGAPRRRGRAGPGFRMCLHVRVVLVQWPTGNAGNKDVVVVCLRVVAAHLKLGFSDANTHRLRCARRPPCHLRRCPQPRRQWSTRRFRAPPQRPRRPACPHPGPRHIRALRPRRDPPRFLRRYPLLYRLSYRLRCQLQFRRLSYAAAHASTNVRAFAGAVAEALPGARVVADAAAEFRTLLAPHTHANTAPNGVALALAFASTDAAAEPSGAHRDRPLSPRPRPRWSPRRRTPTSRCPCPQPGRAQTPARRPLTSRRRCPPVARRCNPRPCPLYALAAAECRAGYRPNARAYATP